jgi:hypothetical protein
LLARFGHDSVTRNMSIAAPFRDPYPQAMAPR